MQINQDDIGKYFFIRCQYYNRELRVMKLVDVAHIQIEKDEAAANTGIFLNDIGGLELIDSHKIVTVAKGENIPDKRSRLRKIIDAVF